MKKCSRLILSVLLLVGILSGNIFYSPKALAAERNPVHFTVSSSFCKSGGTAKILVDVDSNSQISAALFKLKFNTEKLRALEVNTGLTLKNGSVSKNIRTNGEVMVAYTNTSPLYDGGRLFDVTLEAVGILAPDIQYEDITVELEVLDLMDYDDTTIPYQIQQGKLTLINTSYGDVSGQDGVTPLDALITLNAASQLISLTSEQQVLADVNGDNKITPVDALLILQFSAGNISNYPIFVLESPKNLKIIEKDEDYMSLSWDAVSNVIGYNIYLNNNKINQTPVQNTAYTISGLEQNTQYQIGVRAVNTLKESHSAPLSVSTNKAERTVVFKNYDGSIIDTKIVLSGETVTSPNAPSRTGYTFIGWDKPLSDIITDTVITATYSINQYTVTFESCNGNPVTTSQYSYNSLITEPQKSVRTDYTFEGWYKDRTYTKKWDFASDRVDGAITLYGNWVTWSEWSTTVPTVDSEKYTIQQKTEYRYRDKETTTSTNASLSGWTLYNTVWGPEIEVTYAVTASASRQIVKTRTVPATYKTQWGYNRWVNSAGTYSYNSAVSGTTKQEIWLDYALDYKGKTSGVDYWGNYVYNGNTYLQKLWYNQTTRSVVKTAAYTIWTYRDATFYYYRWLAWSDWSATLYTATDNKQVEPRTLYRYLLKQV